MHMPGAVAGEAVPAERCRVIGSQSLGTGYRQRMLIIAWL
jgi:hypothetical protein